MAGISVGLLYRHYKTKDDVFCALVQSAIDGLKQTEGEFAGDPVEVIKWWAKDVQNDIVNDYEFVRFMHILSPSFIADAAFPRRAEIMEANVFFQQQIADLISRGQSDGTFREGNPLGLAQFFLTIVGGMCSMKLVLKDDFIVPEPQTITAFLLKEEYNVYE